MKRILLFILFMGLLSCDESSVKQQRVKRQFGKNKPKVDSVTVNKDTIVIDSVPKPVIIKDNKSSYILYPEMSRLILKKMMENEIQYAGIPEELLNESFFNIYKLDHTDPRIVKFLDETIANFIEYTANRNRIDLKKIKDESANIIIKVKPKK